MTTNHVGAGVVLLGSLAGLVTGGSPPGPGADPPARPGAVTTYDPRPDHTWNRLHRALFVRTTRDGKELGRDALDPLLWPGTEHLLAGRSHEEVVARLDELLGAEGVEQVRDPLKRAVLQRDLWAVFEWLAAPDGRFGPRPPGEELPNPAHPAARKAIQARLARAIDRLALPVKAVRELPDNYAVAVKSKAFPAGFDPEHPDRPFLPADLFDPAGPWVLVGGSPDGPPLALAHTRFFGGRSAFLVFLRLPGGRRATRDYLDTLNKAPAPWVVRERKRADGTTEEFADLRPDLPQFPAGTQVALARRMLLVTDQGTLEVSPVTESVQLRVYRRVRPDMFERDAVKENQAFFEFELRREDLFAGKAGGLRPVPPDEPVYLALQFLTGGVDPFEQPADGERRSHLMPVRDTCAACHPGAGIYGVSSFTRRFSARPGTRPDLTFRPDEVWGELDKAELWKREQYLFGLLRGLTARPEAPGKK
jgi:hypothetical protein